MSGKLRLDLRPRRLAHVVEAAIDTMRPAAAGEGVAIAADLDERRQRDARRSRAAAAGGLEPALERHQVHRRRRSRRAAPGAAAGPSSAQRGGRRSGHRSGRSALRLRSLPPGRLLEHAQAPGARAGARHRAPPGRAARRARRGGQPRGLPGRPPRRQAATRHAPQSASVDRQTPGEHPANPARRCTASGCSSWTTNGTVERRWARS